jgi:beta-glucanase (GH16 family)
VNDRSVPRSESEREDGGTGPGRVGRLLLVPLLLGAGSACAEADEPVAYPGYTGQYPGFTLVLDDRFDGFDEAVWRRGDGAVGGEAMCRFQDQGVRVVDGVLELVIQQEAVPAGYSRDHQQDKGPYDFSCGEMRTTPERRIRYGRIETRMQAPDRASASGYISSLFTYTNDLDAEGRGEWEEIDIELEGIRPDKFQANLIYGLNTWEWWRTREWGAWEDKIVVGPVDEWRVFAIEWLPDRISWYVDGELVKTLAAGDIDCDPACVPPQVRATPIPDEYTDVMVNFWIPNDTIQDTFGGNKRDNVYPMTSRYDWIRYYQYNAEPAETWADRLDAR